MWTIIYHAFNRINIARHWKWNDWRNGARERKRTKWVASGSGAERERARMCAKRTRNVFIWKTIYCVCTHRDRGRNAEETQQESTQHLFLVCLFGVSFSASLGFFSLPPSALFQCSNRATFFRVNKTNTNWNARHMVPHLFIPRMYTICTYRFVPRAHCCCSLVVFFALYFSFQHETKKRNMIIIC